MLKIINDPQVMGEHVNGRVYNIVAWAFSVALIGLSVTLVALAVPLLTRRRARAARVPGGDAAGSAAVVALVRARLDVHQHVGVGDALADVGGDVLGDLVRLGHA